MAECRNCIYQLAPQCPKCDGTYSGFVAKSCRDCKDRWETMYEEQCTKTNNVMKERDELLHELNRRERKIDIVMKERDALKKFERRPGYVSTVEAELREMKYSRDKFKKICHTYAREMIELRDTKEKITEISFLGVKLYRRERR